MKATARRTTGTFTHQIEIRGHRLIVDESAELGGADEGPSPQELLAGCVASCTAVTMQMYANRKGWDIGQLEVECEYEIPERGSATHFNLILRLPEGCTEEQKEKLRVIAGKCPVHRVLEGESIFADQIELVAPVQT
ncbi:MAG TPA: OsmC family protein [Solirubrobacteraceae bacterium]|nr:OsmC family protein [Solirubrobacteraceae bacterium]